MERKGIAMAPVIILTDSTAYLPGDLVASHPIRVLPLTLIWDGQPYKDGVDIKATEFYTRLAEAATLPTTSQVTVGEFEAEFQALVDSGYDVLVMGISKGISASYQSALAAAKRFPASRVQVVDTQLVSMALSFQVLAAARAAQGGASLEECTQVALKAYEQIGVYFTVDTLKYLAAGGRINSAKRLLGTALNLKPILEIRAGKIELVTSVRTSQKALAKMVDLVEEGIGGRQPVRISVFHALAEEKALELMETCRARFSPIELILSEVSPVVGAHVGPGTLSIAYQAGG